LERTEIDRKRTEKMIGKRMPGRQVAKRLEGSAKSISEVCMREESSLPSRIQGIITPPISASKRGQ